MTNTCNHVKPTVDTESKDSVSDSFKWWHVLFMAWEQHWITAYTTKVSIREQHQQSRQTNSWHVP